MAPHHARRSSCPDVDTQSSTALPPAPSSHAGSAMVTSSHNRLVLSELKHLYNLRKFCDVTLTTDSVEFIDCHKIILSAGSGFFRRQFDENDDDVSMIFVSPFTIEAVKNAVEYIYTGACELTGDNAPELLNISYEWDIVYLYRDTVHYMIDHLTTSNAITYHLLADKYDNEELRETTSRYIREHYMDLYLKLYDLSLQAFCTLLQYDEIQVINEDYIFKSVLNWQSHHPPHTKITCLLDAVRFDRLTPEYLTSVVQHHPVMHPRPTPDPVTLALSFQKTGELHNLLKAARKWPGPAQALSLPNSASLKAAGKTRASALSKQSAAAYGNVFSRVVRTNSGGRPCSSSYYYYWHSRDEHLHTSSGY